MKKGRLTILLLLFALRIIPQSYEKDIEQVYKHFVNAPKIAFQVKYVLKESHNPASRIVTESKGRYIKEKENTMSVFDSKATLTTSGEIIMIDTEQKNMVIKHVKTKPQANVDFLSVLKESAANTETVRQQNISMRDRVMYLVKLKEGSSSPVSSYEIIINTKTYYVEQLNLFYRKKLQENEDYKVTGKEVPRLEIVFSSFNSPNLYTIKELQSSYYYSKNNNTLSPTQNFKGYAIKEIF